MNKILIFESETVLLNLLVDILNLEGFHVITTALSEQGYQLTKLEKPDLILCGYSSKNMNKYENYENCSTFLQKIRQDLETVDIPFIMMTGGDLEKIHNWRNYLKEEDILLKPFNSEILLEKIYAHLQSSRIKSKRD